MFVLSINGDENAVESIADIVSRLNEVADLKFAEIWLSKHSDEESSKLEKVTYGVLGLTPPKKESSIGVLTNREVAFATFEEDDENYFNSYSAKFESETNDIEFELFNGQRDYYPKKNCISKDQAFEAIFYFFTNLEKHDSISWRKS